MSAKSLTRESNREICSKNALPLTTCSCSVDIILYTNSIHPSSPLPLPPSSSFSFNRQRREKKRWSQSEVQ